MLKSVMYDDRQPMLKSVMYDDSPCWSHWSEVWYFVQGAYLELYLKQVLASRTRPPHAVVVSAHAGPRVTSTLDGLWKTHLITHHTSLSPTHLTGIKNHTHQTHHCHLHAWRAVKTTLNYSPDTLSPTHLTGIKNHNYSSDTSSLPTRLTGCENHTYSSDTSLSPPHLTGVQKPQLLVRRIAGVTHMLV